MSHADPIVSVSWLKDRLAAADLRIVDASWFLDGSRDPDAEYLQRHIPGAVRVDIDRLSDHQNPLPHMLPDPMEFARTVGALGLGSENRIVVYASDSLYAAARVWWMFRVMGHDAVTVLDGGLPKWIAARCPIETGEARPEPVRFYGRYRKELVKTFEQVARALYARKTQLVDARAAARFRGEAPEPRAGLASGHMPGALNLPHSEVVNPDQTLKSKAALKEVFAKAKVSLDKPIITTCGSGVSAALLALALARLGHWDVPVYDGSWSEWGSHKDAPVATGAD